MWRLLSLALVLGSAVGAQAQSLWEHNGSTVYLEAHGATRKFYYEAPRLGLPVRKGTLVFSGARDGDRYIGKAYIFHQRCGPVAYAVNGTVAADERSVVMRGKAPALDSKCSVVSFKDDILVFTFRSDARTAYRSHDVMTIGRDSFVLHADAALKLFGKELVLDQPGAEEGLHDIEFFNRLLENAPVPFDVTVRRSTGLANAFAVLREDTRYIVYDPSVYKWGVMRYLVFGHEMGHHVCGHTVGLMAEGPWDKELEADRFAGAALRNMDGQQDIGSLTAALESATERYPEHGSSSHPPRALRLKAIWEGYSLGSHCMRR